MFEFIQPMPKCEESAQDPRRQALESAILFRNCSERLHVSRATSAVCRTLMRERALKWRALARLVVAK